MTVVYYKVRENRDRVLGISQCGHRSPGCPCPARRDRQEEASGCCADHFSLWSSPWWLAHSWRLQGRRRRGLGTSGSAFPNGGVDPFSFYYGYYLPHQAAIAAQPTSLDTINQVTAQRQFTALSERQGLYDPISPYGEDDLDPNRPYSARRGGDRGPDLHAPGDDVEHPGNRPGLYYSRTARYFPQLRAGKGPNRNLAVTKRGGMAWAVAWAAAWVAAWAAAWVAEWLAPAEPTRSDQVAAS